MKFNVAAIQMASGTNVLANLTEAARLIRDAAQAGAQVVVLPENFAIMGMAEEDKVSICEEDGTGQIQDFLAEQAAKYNVWIFGGTSPICADESHVYAACLVYDDTGQRVGRYDKIHLFDVHLQESSETYNESETIKAGDKVSVVDTPFGRIGMAICYDLRFPELFRELAMQGAQVIVVPSAFTAITGKAHWEVLVRARAVENLCFVVASAQGGYHVNGRETHGNSMIVDPWGNVLDQLESGSGFVITEIDTENVEKIRQSFPALNHRKLNCNLSH